MIGVDAALDVVVHGNPAALQLHARLDAAAARRAHVVELERQRVLERIEMRRVLRSSQRRTIVQEIRLVLPAARVLELHLSSLARLLELARVVEH